MSEEPGGPRTVDAVVFDWGGTLTPWHTIDLREQWLHYAEVYDPEHADELSARILSAEDAAWQAGREHHRSATLDEIFRGVGVDVDSDRLGEVVAHLSSFGLTSLTSHPPTLEELFLRHYAREGAPVAQAPA